MSNTTYNPASNLWAPANAPGTGMTQELTSRSGFLWATGNLESDIIEKMIFLKYGVGDDYFLNDFLQHFGGLRNKPTFNREFEWREMGKTRFGITVVAPSGGFVWGAATLVIENAITKQRTLVGQVYNVPYSGGILARVTAVAMTGAGATESITLTKLDGTNWASGDLEAGATLGQLFLPVDEGSTGVGFRTWGFDRAWNRLTTIRAAYKYTGDAASTKMEVSYPGSGESPVDMNLHITLKEFQQDREHVLMWSKMSTTDPMLSGRGVVPDVIENSSLFHNYNGTADEADLQTFIRTVDGLSGQSEFLFLQGADLYFNTQDALKDYLTDGAFSYGAFSQGRQVALGWQVGTYNYGGKMIHLKRYRGFDNPDVTGRLATGTLPSSGATGEIDYQKFGLALNMGTAADAVQGNGPMPLICRMYRAMGKQNRSLVVGTISGMTGVHNGMMDVPSDVMGDLRRNAINTDEDADTVHLLSQVGVAMPMVSMSHAFMRNIGA